MSAIYINHALWIRERAALCLRQVRAAQIDEVTKSNPNYANEQPELGLCRKDLPPSLFYGRATLFGFILNDLGCQVPATVVAPLGEEN